MSILRGTGSNPNPRKFVPADIANRGKVEEAYDGMMERLEAYQAYHATEAGHIARVIADTQITYLVHMLTISLREFCSLTGISVDKAEEVRAEFRGELRVWKLLKTEPERLKRMVEKGKENGAGSQGKEAGWETLSEKTL